jgi:hypothetical protein
MDAAAHAISIDRNLVMVSSLGARRPGTARRQIISYRGLGDERIGAKDQA